MKYLIANWKCYKTEQDSLLWLDTFLKNYSPHPDVEIILAPSFLSLSRMTERIAGFGKSGLSLAAQNVSAFPRGGYTGEISADLLKPYARYGIIGHLERRKYCRETQNDITNKVSETVDANMVPILCLEDETLAPQLASIVDVDSNDIILAYTPSYALNSHIAEPIGVVIKALADMRKFRPKSKCIYGGAVNEKNASLYWNAEGVDGLFVGKASHRPEDFLAIIKACLKR